MRIITFYNEKINPIVVDYQKKVFNHFKYDINQINVSNWVSHGKSIDDYLTTIEDPNEVIVLFDIDCIPLNKKIIGHAVKWVIKNDGVFGNSQLAPNLKEPHNTFIYVAPSFMVFTMKTYERLGRPSFTTSDRSDCGGEITHNAIEKNVNIKLLYPTSVEIPTFKLKDNIWFGYGTNYENNTYHSFESRFRKKDSFFLNKCKSILNI